MKKALAVLVLALFAGTAAFAVPVFGVSAGGGGIFTKAFGGGAEGGGYTIDFPSFGGGAFVFLDATFAELDLDLTYNSGTIGSGNGDFNFSAFGFALLGKYPFVMGPVDIFPMLGIGYRRVLSMEIGGQDYDDASDWSRFSIRFGAGVDYYFTPALFLRGEILYAIGFENKLEKDIVDDENSRSRGRGQNADASSKISHGPDIKIAVGYRFF
jgi:opacity protein-like surface antigen